MFGVCMYEDGVRVCDAVHEGLQGFVLGWHSYRGEADLAQVHAGTKCLKCMCHHICVDGVGSGGSAL